MQKWEYCSLGPFRDASWGGYYPRLTYYTDKGPKHFSMKEFNKDIETSEGLARTIAALGNDGWEMVGFGAVPGRHDEAHHIIYFKRPIED